MLEPGNATTYLSAAAGQRGRLEIRGHCAVACGGSRQVLAEAVRFEELNMVLVQLAGDQLLEVCVELRGASRSFVTLLASSRKVNILPDGVAVPWMHAHGHASTLFEVPAPSKPAVQLIEVIECTLELTFFYNYNLEDVAAEVPNYGLHMMAVADGHTTFSKGADNPNQAMFFKVISRPGE